MPDRLFPIWRRYALWAICYLSRRLRAGSGGTDIRVYTASHADSGLDLVGPIFESILPLTPTAGWIWWDRYSSLYCLSRWLRARSGGTDIRVYTTSHAHCGLDLVGPIFESILPLTPDCGLDLVGPIFESILLLTPTAGWIWWDRYSSLYCLSRRLRAGSGGTDIRVYTTSHADCGLDLVGPIFESILPLTPTAGWIWWHRYSSLYCLSRALRARSGGTDIRVYTASHADCGLDLVAPIFESILPLTPTAGWFWWDRYSSLYCFSRRLRAGSGGTDIRVYTASHADCELDLVGPIFESILPLMPTAGWIWWDRYSSLYCLSRRLRAGSGGNDIRVYTASHADCGLDLMAPIFESILPLTPTAGWIWWDRYSSLYCLSRWLRAGSGGTDIRVYTAYHAHCELDLVRPIFKSLTVKLWKWRFTNLGIPRLSDYL